MSYAGKSHAHRDLKNDYDRKSNSSVIEDELDLFEEELGIIPDTNSDFIDKIVDYMEEIAIQEYERGIKDCGLFEDGD